MPLLRDHIPYSHNGCDTLRMSLVPRYPRPTGSDKAGTMVSHQQHDGGGSGGDSGIGGEQAEATWGKSLYHDVRSLPGVRVGWSTSA